MIHLQGRSLCPINIFLLSQVATQKRAHQMAMLFISEQLSLETRFTDQGSSFYYILLHTNQLNRHTLTTIYLYPIDLTDILPILVCSTIRCLIKLCLNSKQCRIHEGCSFGQFFLPYTVCLKHRYANIGFHYYKNFTFSIYLGSNNKVPYFYIF